MVSPETFNIPRNALKLERFTGNGFVGIGKWLQLVSTDQFKSIRSASFSEAGGEGFLGLPEVSLDQ